MIAGLPGVALHRFVALLCMLLAALSMTASHAAEAPRDAAGLVAVPTLARVTDLAGALKPADVQALETKLAAYEIAKGSQIAIVVLPTTQPEPIADFAQRVGDAWKIGRKGVGDGVLITVAIEDRRVWISVGRALEGALPDVTATRISREVIAPRFRDGDYGGGLLAGLDAILKRLDGEALPPPASGAGAVSVGGDVVPILLGIVLAGIGVGSALRRMLGVPGALVAAGGSGVVTGALLASALLGGLAGLVVLVGSVMGGSGGGGAGRVLGGRRRGGAPIFIPGGWSGGGSGGSGGGWGGGGGWSSGGGGDFAGGGGGSSW